MSTSIAEKIKALLAKAASTNNEHEAEAFFAKAYELMERYQLDEGDLETGDPMGHERTTKRNGRVTPDWDFRLMRGCAKYYGCEAIRSWDGHWYMELVGRESARVTAIEMHKYLVGVVRKLGRDNAAEMRCNADQAARRIGTMLNERLLSLAPKPAAKPTTKAGKNALVTLDALEAHIKREFPNLSMVKGANTIRTRSAQAIAEGIGLNLQAGQNSTLALK